MQVASHVIRARPKKFAHRPELEHPDRLRHGALLTSVFPRNPAATTRYLPLTAHPAIGRRVPRDQLAALGLQARKDARGRKEDKARRVQRERRVTPVQRERRVHKAPLVRTVPTARTERLVQPERKGLLVPTARTERLVQPERKAPLVRMVPTVRMVLMGPTV